MKNLLVVDGNSMVNRAYYGMHSPLSTVEGQPTGAVYGFFTMLHKILRIYRPEGVCVTFDVKGHNFRKDIYEGYKSSRKGMESDLASQIPLVRRVLEGMGIPWFGLESWEADDLMGTISKKMEEETEDWHTVIASGDRDILQLVSERTSVHLMLTKETTCYTPALFFEEYGFDPIHLIDLKALMGDKADDIPGIKGVGDKKAIPLIQEYQSLDMIYEKLKDPEETLGMKPAALKKLREGEEMARLSYDLATIRRNAPLEGFSVEAVTYQGVAGHQESLPTLMAELELNQLVETYGIQVVQVPESEVLGECVSEVVTTLERGQALLEQWQGKRLVVLWLPSLYGFSVYSAEDGLCAVLMENQMGAYEQMLQDLFLGDFSIIVYSSKALQYELLQRGISASNIIFDVELAAYLLAPDHKEYSLEYMGKRYLKFTPRSEDLYGEECFSPLGNSQEALDVMVSHTLLLSKLAGILLEKLQDFEMMSLYQEIELPLCGILAKMQKEGISVDRPLLEAYGKKLLARCEELEKLIHQEAGEEFNISSPQQLGEILFEKLEFPSGKKTKKGYSTDMEVLEKLRGEYPERAILSYLIEFRQVSKLHSTYAKGLLKELQKDGKIRSVFKNTVVGTGRLSSTEPNLQNIPIRTTLGAELRHMFVAEEGCVLIDADYSQIELRLLAHLSQDEGMISAFNSGEDFHTQTASRVFALPVEQVDSEKRRAAKAVNFGIIYGMGAYSLSQDIGVPIYAADEYITKYFATYPGVKLFMNAVVAEAVETGYVTTMFGRRRWVPEVSSSNLVTKKGGERVAQNVPMQGTAADIMKKAMVSVDELLKDYPEAKILLQIHDEIIVQCPEGQGEELREKIVSVMEGVANLSVPLLVEGNCGKSWGDSH